MEQKEFSHIIAALIILTVVISFSSILDKSYSFIPVALIFSLIILIVNIGAKKLAANSLDSDIEHELWFTTRLSIKPKNKFKRPFPSGIVIPLLISFFSLGIVKFLTVLTYETRALKRRAAKRHGFYSFTEMTDLHNALIGSAGILALIILSIITYLLPYSLTSDLAKFSIFYAFWNMLPIGKFDGTQIYFGSPVIYSILAAITAILAALALIAI
tara:strand:+ start:2273 stop:2917 length:645 start_codon:yes stop_codon:yes gene_type:complete